MSRNIHEIEANADVDPSKAFESAFPAQAIDELLLEFDPKHSGPPVVTFGGDGGAKKAAWIKDALLTQIPTNFPKIKAVLWFNWDDSSGKTYPIETSLAATTAWAAGIASPVYASNQFGNLNISPIPMLTGVSSTVRIPLITVRRQ